MATAAHAGKRPTHRMSSQALKLVFPGGEHPQVLLSPGRNGIGSGAGNSIVIDRPGIRPEHCELQVNLHGVMLRVPDGVVVEVNGRPVEGLIALRPGDVVGFDEVQARLVSLEVAGSAAPAVTGAVPANDDGPAATAIRPAVPRYVLRGVSGRNFGRSFPLVGDTVVGRAPECTLRFDEDGVSRLHVRLEPLLDGIRVQDLGSTNGTFINGRRVRMALARHGDEIGFDRLRFRVLAPGRSEAAEDTSPVERTGRVRWMLAAAALAAMAAVALVAVA